eukprot:Seg2105.2 transcript_id=Seg2105.2/GoldUCD/mRNA.D3Y31 product="Protein BTG1" protein_id=Seg2105.2/GoldUCD/D3Y31
MKDEVKSAAQFVCDKLKEKDFLSDEQCELFKTTLEELMLQRFDNHWHPEKPLKGNAYRCLNINHEECVLDPMLKQAAIESFIDLDDLRGIFPNGLALWVDPFDVSYRLGNGRKAAICPIFKRYNPYKAPPQGHQRKTYGVQNQHQYSHQYSKVGVAGQRPNTVNELVSKSKLNTAAPSFIPTTQQSTNFIPTTQQSTIFGLTSQHQSTTKPSQDLSQIWSKNFQNTQQQRWEQPSNSSQEFYSYFQRNADQKVYNRYHWHHEEHQQRPAQQKKLSGRGFEFRTLAQEAY